MASASFDADSLIDALGGTAMVAKELAIDPPVVSNWRSRGNIPSSHWTGIVELAGRRRLKGITLQMLAEMRGLKIKARA